MRFVLTALLTVCICTAHHADACSCPPPPAPDKALEVTHAVFMGKATKVAVAGGVRTTTFKIARTWKGTTGQTIVVKTAEHGATCGYIFKEGESYLVYANHDAKKKQFWTNICTRTRTKAAAAGDIKVIGKGGAEAGEGVSRVGWAVPTLRAELKTQHTACPARPSGRLAVRAGR